VAPRVSAHAGRGEVLASSTVHDLVAGSGIVFADRGTTQLKDVGDWHLYEVADA
jgi:class 3 adenylate cyclase